MNERLEREFIPALLGRAIDYHCRQGIRAFCECSFCNEKRRATASFMHVGPPGSTIFERGCLTRGIISVSELLDIHRDNMRREIRERLQQLKKEL